jgi:hypothetical protein
MTDTVTGPARPPAPKGALPKGVILSPYWRETPNGEIIKHGHARPVDETSDVPVGVWWMCPQDGCPTGEWVFPRPDGTQGRPKRRYCPDHGDQVLPGQAAASADDPQAAARSWLQQRLTERAAATRQAVAAAATARIDQIRAAGRAEAQQIAADAREHVPSATVSAAVLAVDMAALAYLDPLATYALGVGLAVGGTVLTYLAVYTGEIVYARRMGYTLRGLPRHLRARARGHARWVAGGVLASGVWLAIAETLGAEIDNLRGLLMALFGAVLAGVVNYRPWAQMVARRKAEAAARTAAAETAARAEEERLAAGRRREAEAEAARAAAAEAALAAAKKIVCEEDDRITAGRKFADRWRQIADAARTVTGNGAGFEIWRTQVVVDETRKLTARDANGEFVIGWEFLIKAEPGVLAPRSGSDASPFMTMRRWLASMLEMNVSMVDLTYQPARLTDGSDRAGKPEPMINHGLVTLSERFPLGRPVKHLGRDGVYVDDAGSWWGHAGSDLRGRPVYRRLWTPGQAGGAGRYGITGSGKSVVTQQTALNDLYAGILPIVHDAGKSAMDFADFYGVFPVGHTIEHREVIRESLWAEMKRRQAWTNMRTTVGLGGMEVTADPTWDPAVGGPPIRCTWEEFHVHIKDPKFVVLVGEMLRLQRATAIMAELATQGTGLTDTGDNNLREQVNEICLQLMRMTDHTARLAGYNGAYRTSELPRLPGMMIMVDGQGDPVPYRSTFVPRDPQNPDSLIYQLRRPNGTPEGEQILFPPDLPPETVEVFERYGLMDLWELGKTRSGRERLQSEADPVESTEFPPSLASLLSQAGQPVVKPHMRAEDVVLALLKHETDQARPGLTQQEILASDWWGYVSGEWVKNADGRPSHTTVSRACNRLSTLTEQQTDAGLAPLVASDGGKPARWSLQAAGVERGEQMLILLRSAGALGTQGRAQVAASGVDVAAMERQAMLEAEQQALIQTLVREAAESMRQ